jgi:AhpD family alkylhydroperoxidase
MRTGSVVVLKEPLSIGALVRAARLKLGHADDSSNDFAGVRLFLETGDEVEVEQLEKDDVVYISFDGDDFISQASSSTEAVEEKFIKIITAVAEASQKNGRLPGGRSSLMADSTVDLLSPGQPPLADKRFRSIENVPSERPECESGKYAAFVSHMKAEAAMEARFVQTWLQEKLGAPVFLDSDDLRDLTKLTQHVRDSAVLVLIQSKQVLTRPYCILELLTAIKYGVPIVGLCLTGVTAEYAFPDAHHFLTNLDNTLEHTKDEAVVQLLAEHGWQDLTNVAYLLSSVIPARISIPFHPGASASAINATLEDLCNAMQEATPVDCDALPKKVQWQQRRSAKSWGNWTEALADHHIYASYWTAILGAYIGPNSLDSILIEGIMLTVNSINQCTFCSGLHCEIGRMAGLAQPLQLNQARSAEECIALSSQSEVFMNFAHTFACYDGRGAAVEEAFDALAHEHGEGKALSARALCWFLHWGSWTGNTLNGAVSYRNPKPDASQSFLLQILLYYFVLFFGIINLVSILIKILPRMPSCFMAFFGIVLCTVAGVVFTPLGWIGALTRCCDKDDVQHTVPALSPSGARLTYVRTSYGVPIRRGGIRYSFVYMFVVVLLILAGPVFKYFFL